MKNKIPLLVKIKANFIPLKKYEDSNNLATGEIRKFEGTMKSKKNGLVSFDGEYSILWEYICGDYYKEVSKTLDDRNC